MKYKIFVHLEGESIGIGGLHTATKNQREAIRKSNILELADSPFDADIVHINNVGVVSNFLLTLKRFKDLKAVIHAHSLVGNIPEGFAIFKGAESILENFLSFTYNRGDILIAPSEFCADKVSEIVDGDVPVRNFSNGINLKDFDEFPSKDEVREKYGVEGTVICSVGNVFERKGVEEFIKLGEYFEDMDFFWFGPISWSAGRRVREMIENSPENVTFTGRVENILEAYSLADIFVFPSRHETQGLVLLEAAASYLPIVVRDLPAYSWIKDGKECLKSSDMEELRENVSLFLKNPSLRSKFSKSARSLAEKHSIDELRENLESTYMEVME